MLCDKEFAGFHDGIFKKQFEWFIEFKRGKGEKVAHSTLIRLKTLNNVLIQYCPTLEISRTVAETILCEKAGEHPATRALRVSDLRQFSSFLSGQGINSYQIPVKYTKQAHTPFRPYIFSEQELYAVTDVADKYELKPRRKKQVSHYPVIVRILIGTGLRIGELLSLCVQDVDTQNNVLSIHRAKNNVSRYVPRQIIGIPFKSTEKKPPSNPEVTRTVIENAALKTIPNSAEYYSPEEKADLIAFLDELV